MNLVELEPMLPAGTIIDARYATDNNFTGVVQYRGENAILRLDKPAAEALVYVAGIALQAGVRLVILDAFRPEDAHERLVAFHHGADKYVLPVGESYHPKGLAVDVWLADKDSNPLDLGTEFDEFGPRSHHGATGLGWQQEKDRALLNGIMETRFVKYEPEIWHYNYLADV